MLQLLQETIRQQAIINNIQLLLSARREIELLKELDAQQARLDQVKALEAAIEWETLWNSLTLTVQQLASLLKISVAHAYKSLKDGTVPRHLLGTRYIISRGAIMQWVNGDTTSTSRTN
jgi:excisionase family DNA binding protein